MKWFLICTLFLVVGNTFAQDQLENQQNDIEITKDQFSDGEVSKALETAESTLDQIGRDIASEGEIEVVE